MSSVGTSIRTTENALAPDSFVRVLIAIDARSAGVGAPNSLWYRPAASAAAVRNVSLMLPPRRLAAAFVGSN